MAVGWHHPTVEIDLEEVRGERKGIFGSRGEKSKWRNQGDELWAVDIQIISMAKML